MTGLAVDIRVREAVEAVQDAFTEFGEKAFARAVQYSLNRVTVEATNRFRERMPIELRHANAFTLKAVRYELDKTRLSAVSNLDDIVSAVFLQPLQSTWMKYAFGETHRPGGDVGIEAFMPNQSQIYIPNEDGLRASFGIRPNGAGNYRSSDMRIIGRALAAGYERNTGYGGKWGAFEIKHGDRDAARLGVGVHARPPRGLAINGRERLKSKMRRGQASAPRTQFTAAGGRQVDVPKVVNMDRPRLLFLTQPDATYKPLLTPSWEDEMQRAASRIGDYMEEELVNKLEHAVAKGRKVR
ncbi:hypothetical protein A3862_04275 [Methylobacterium sp. XJLW]|uniref:hypothetical protein n=1 Tax=Methylobacterium sp. XJLW TaxID=739141 RepID=UPI000DAB058A|nr:hypothetical protein [Methylobacterium sp. XJLW]AWV14815.1 hypothetical protein A3862_04275 [Methylobacterium sp. XJLW]